MDIPTTAVDPMRGSVAFWLKPAWIGETNAGSAFFGALKNPNAPYKEQASAIAINAYARPEAKGWENGINVSFKSKTRQQAAYTVDVDERFKADDWFHVLVTWEIVPAGDSVSVFYLNGKRAAEKHFAMDGIEPPATVYMGYAGGGYADGLMDEFYLFNRPLTDAEAAAIFRLAGPLKATGVQDELRGVLPHTPPGNQ